MNKKLVSLITVNFNGFRITKEMIGSIYANTTYRPFEIIVVDNSSTDDSCLKLEKYLSKKKNTILIRRKINDFLTGGYNAGSKKAKGKIFVFLNNDLIMSKNWLTPLVRAFDQPNVGIAGSTMLVYKNKDIIDNLGGKRNWLGFGLRIDPGKKFKSQSGLKEVDYVPGSLIAINKELFNRLDKFDKDYFGNYEDVDLAWRVKNIGYKTAIALESVVYHRGSWTVDKEQDKIYSSYLCRRNRLRTMVKNASFLHLLLALPVYFISQLLLFFKELIIDRNLKLALTSIKAIVWNASRIT